MLKDRLYRGASWLALRSPDDDSGRTSVAVAGPEGGAAAAEGTTPVEPAAAGEAAAGGTEPADGQTADPAAAEPPAPKPQPSQEVVNRLTAEKWSERRARESAENALRLANETIESMKRQPAAEPGSETDINGEPIQRRTSAAAPAAPAVTPERLQAMAAEIAQNNEFNSKVVASIEAGRKAYPDFDNVAAKLQTYGDLPRPFVQALLATGKSHDVLYAIANDTAEADRILSLRDSVELAFAVKAYADGVTPKAAAKTVSSAPKPISPNIGVTGNSVPDLASPDLPMKDWLALREKQVAAAPKGRR